MCMCAREGGSEETRERPEVKRVRGCDGKRSDVGGRTGAAFCSESESSSDAAPPSRFACNIALHQGPFFSFWNRVTITYCSIHSLEFNRYACVLRTCVWMHVCL